MPNTDSGIVYHYCSLEAFKSIIENECLWLCDVEKSNDSAERSYFNKMMLDTIKQYITTFSASEQNVSQKLTALQQLQETLQTPQAETSSIYSCSFSRHKDLLSQWRGYADDGYGISIGFSKTLFEKEFPQECFRPVNYNKNELEKACEQILQEAINYYFSGNSHTQNKNAVSLFILTVLHQVVHNNIFFKSECFLEEKEYRLATADLPDPNGISCTYYHTNNRTFWLSYPQILNDNNHNLYLSDKKFRIHNHKLSSYYELSFSKVKNDIIPLIYLGPKCLAEPRDIYALLKHNGYNAEMIKIIRSAATYR